jgi:hypothetical protein
VSADDLRLTHYEDVTRAGEAQLRKLADELRLPVQSKPVRRAVAVGLEMESINLYECRPDSGLAGYGQVAPATADYLECEIPKLDALLRSLILLLQAPAPKNADKQLRLARRELGTTSQMLYS